MSFLVDTNVLSERRKGERCNPGVAGWFASTDAADIFISALCVGELRKGIESIRRRDPRSAIRLDAWLGQVLAHYRERILPVDPFIADAWGRMCVPDPLPAVDGLMAATAQVHGLTLVTRNVRHVANTGVPLIDPFT